MHRSNSSQDDDDIAADGGGGGGDGDGYDGNEENHLQQTNISKESRPIERNKNGRNKNNGYCRKYPIVVAGEATESEDDDDDDCDGDDENEDYLQSNDSNNRENDDIFDGGNLVAKSESIINLSNDSNDRDRRDNFRQDRIEFSRENHSASESNDHHGHLTINRSRSNPYNTVISKTETEPQS